MAKRIYKSRRICTEPDYLSFVPVTDEEEYPETVMTVDEYEAVRLIDLEELSQEECAKRMGVARATVQLIYNSARKKMAEALVYGTGLRIEGGNYYVCDGDNLGCGRCDREENLKHMNTMTEKEDGVMRIAATYENGEIFQHFGRTQEFKVYEVVDGKVISSEMIGTGGQGHGALAGVLSLNQVDVLICGGIGGGAQTALANAGIELCAGASGNTDQAVQDFLEGKLVNTGSNCNHHHHEEGHACVDHGCGSHSCH